MKPEDYFAPEWRRTPGVGGTFLINLIHEIDLLRYVCGEIVSLSAFASNAARGLAVEDTGAIIFDFENGALASLVVSDTAAGPWSWDLTADDSRRFPAHDVNSHRIVGTEAALTLPRLEVWRHDGARDWTVPMTMTPGRHASGRTPTCARSATSGPWCRTGAATHVGRDRGGAQHGGDGGGAAVGRDREPGRGRRGAAPPRGSRRG